MQINMFSNDSPEVRRARTAALSRLRQFQLNQENSFARSPRRAGVSSGAQESEKPQTWARVGKGRPPPRLLAAQAPPSLLTPRISPFPHGLAPGPALSPAAAHPHLPDL